MARHKDPTEPGDIKLQIKGLAREVVYENRQLKTAPTRIAKLIKEHDRLVAKLTKISTPKK
jgi:hypothetical protein